MRAHPQRAGRRSGTRRRHVGGETGDPQQLQGFSLRPWQPSERLRELPRVKVRRLARTPSAGRRPGPHAWRGAASGGAGVRARSRRSRTATARRVAGARRCVARRESPAAPPDTRRRPPAGWRAVAGGTPSTRVEGRRATNGRPRDRPIAPASSSERVADKMRHPTADHGAARIEHREPHVGRRRKTPRRMNRLAPCNVCRSARQLSPQQSSRAPVHAHRRETTMKPSVLQFLLVATCLIGTVGTAPGGTPTPHQPGSRGIDRRGDVRNVPAPLKERLVELAGRPHTYPPLTIFSEAPAPSQLFVLLPARHHGLPAERLHQRSSGSTTSRRSRSTGANQTAHDRLRCASRSSRSPVCPPIPMIPSVHRHLHRHRPAVCHQQRVGLVRGLDDPRPALSPTSCRRAADGTRSSERSPRPMPISCRQGQRQQRAGGTSHARRQCPHVPSATDHFPTRRRMWCRCSSAWVHTTRSSKATRTPTGNSTSTRDWVFPLYELPFTGGFAESTPRTAAFLSTSCPAPDPPALALLVPASPAGRTIRGSSATTPTIPATPTARSTRVRPTPTAAW